MQKKTYYVYIAICNDQSLYTGYTTDLKRRMEEHNHGSLGARYTRGRRPVALVYSEKFLSESAAKAREAEIKILSRKEKLGLMAKK